HCLHCHNSEKPKRGLDLSHLETLLKGSKSGRVVLPGKSSGSLLFQVLHEEDKPHMPPKEPLEQADNRATAQWSDRAPPGVAPEGPALKDDADRLRRAFRKTTAPEIPEVKNKSWARNPIDSFTLSRLEEKGLEPSPEAGKATLLRRAALDLLGLPPSGEELDA